MNTLVYILIISLQNYYQSKREALTVQYPILRTAQGNLHFTPW